MKTLTLIFLSFFLSKSSCQDKKEITSTATPSEMAQTKTPEVVKNQEATLLEYTAFSRGTFLKITYQNAKIWVAKDRNTAGNGMEMVISKNKIDEIENFIKSFKMDSLEKLEAPTQNRLHDGAAHGNLRILVSGVEYQTQGFDAGAPPKEIEKIVTLLSQYSEKVK